MTPAEIKLLQFLRQQYNITPADAYTVGSIVKEIITEHGGKMLLDTQKVQVEFVIKKQENEQG